MSEQWINDVKDQIENASLASAGVGMMRLVSFALKTQHDEQFARDVDSCVKLFWERCNREAVSRDVPITTDVRLVDAPPVPPEVAETIKLLLTFARYGHDGESFIIERIDAALAWLEQTGQVSRE